MKRRRRWGGLITALLINMVLNPRWSIPAWVLLGLHFWLDIPIWWFAAGIGLWIARILAGMWLVGWAADCGSQKDPPKENRNPYSVKRNDNADDRKEK